jgi:hypothetical protein
VQQGSSLTLQRYPVPSDLPCDDIVPWLTANSPYKPEWAQTACDYTFQPPSLPYTWKPLPDRTIEVTVLPDNARTVSVNCPVDRPEWSPDSVQIRKKQAAEAAAYSAMRAVLDAHEADHQKIGGTWQGTLESRFKALAFTIIAANEKQAAPKVTQEAQKAKSKWTADAQAAQSAIVAGKPA